MKRMNKRIAVMLLAALMIALLAGCGLKGSNREKDGTDQSVTKSESATKDFSPESLRGSYHEKNGTSTLVIGEDKMLLINEKGRWEGRYSTNGNLLSFFYTLTDAETGRMGSSEWLIILRWDGDDLVFEGHDDTIYVRDKGNGIRSGVSFGTILRIVGGAAGALVLLALLLRLMKKGRRAKNGKQPTEIKGRRGASHAATATAESFSNVSRRAAASARDVTASVSAGITAGVTAAKSSLREQRKIPISMTACCICGGSLEEGAIPLGGLSSGTQAYIDHRCLTKLQAMAQGDSYEEYEKAARYMHGQLPCVDPEVGEALDRFVKKCSVRFVPSEEKPFNL